MRSDLNELGLIIIDTPLYSDTLGGFVDPSPDNPPLSFRCADMKLNIAQLPQYAASAQPYANVVAHRPTVKNCFVVTLCTNRDSFNAADFFSRIHKLQEHYDEFFKPDTTLMNAYKGYHNCFKTLSTCPNTHSMLEIPRDQLPRLLAVD